MFSLYVVFPAGLCELQGSTGSREGSKGSFGTRGSLLWAWWPCAAPAVELGPAFDPMHAHMVANFHLGRWASRARCRRHWDGGAVDTVPTPLLGGPFGGLTL